MREKPISCIFYRFVPQSKTAFLFPFCLQFAYMLLFGMHGTLLQVKTPRMKRTKAQISWGLWRNTYLCSASMNWKDRYSNIFGSSPLPPWIIDGSQHLYKKRKQLLHERTIIFFSLLLLLLHFFISSVAENSRAFCIITYYHKLSHLRIFT